MLILPVSKSPDWRNPPLITILLILLNVLIFFGLQSGDEARRQQAIEYYASSDLSDIEFPRYVEYLRKEGKTKKLLRVENALENDQKMPVFISMLRDRDFMRRLQNNEIIQPDEEEFETWRRDRDHFEKLWNSTITDRYGFKPAAPTFSSLIAHMFLHGGIDHLFGNMLFLFIVGYMVEESLGKSRYLIFYLLTGIGAAGLDFVVNADRLVPGIGASGAVSGVMAMYLVLYGMQKIRFFYWVFVYFDFFRAPALVVLPFWIGNELYQYFYSSSNVNYMAHLGGYLTGTLLVILYRISKRNKLDLPAQEVEESVYQPVSMKKVDELLGALKLEEARKLLASMVTNHPQDVVVVSRYFKIASHAPSSDDFHRAARYIFALEDNHPSTNDLIYDSFKDYLKKAKPSVQFTSRTLVKLIRRLAISGHPLDAERLLRVLEKRDAQAKELPALMLIVSESFRRIENTTMQKAILLRLQEVYPDSDAARSVKAMIG